MSNPLSPRSHSSLNVGSPATTQSKPNSPVKQGKSSLSASSLSPSPNNNSTNSTNSSPFQSDVGSKPAFRPYALKESPTRAIMSPRSRNSPASHKAFDIYTEPAQNTPPPPPRSSPDHLPDISPCKIPLPSSSPFDDRTKTSLPSPPKQEPPHDHHSQLDFDDSFNDSRSILSEDTTFSAFSAIPDLTTFAAARGQQPVRSPTRSPFKLGLGSQTPSQSVFMTPATSRRRAGDASRPASPTPRRQQPPASKSNDNDTTSLLLDFTGTLDGATMSRLSPSKAAAEPNLLSYINSQRNPSPSKATPRPAKNNLMNLLDFDLPPQPTPRSVPSITIRELESLKSTYLSEISSLKASLSGRDAEVDSLKKAVSDAERRVGESLEKEREERSAREHAQAERRKWEEKGTELESLLRKVREDFILGEKEKEDLAVKLEESNRAKEEAQLKASERAPVVASDFDPSASGQTDHAVSQRVAQQLDEKMESLARELHAVYKKKHEGKVATLKKTYEARADKKCLELQRRIDDLSRHNEDLQAAKDSSLSMELADRRNARSSDDAASELSQQKAHIAGLVEEMASVRESHARLLKDLELERVEKGELVAAVDEMLALQSEPGAPSVIDDFRKSISRGSGSGLRASGSVSGIARPGRALSSVTSTAAGKSRMMSNIERMGSGRAAE